MSQMLVEPFVISVSGFAFYWFASFLYRLHKRNEANTQLLTNLALRLGDLETTIEYIQSELDDVEDSIPQKGSDTDTISPDELRFMQEYINENYVVLE